MSYNNHSFGFLLIFFIISVSSSVKSQTIDIATIADAANGLKMRSIGPAVMGGRIADIAVSEQDPSNWYVAVGSGGLWKTSNNGISWKPVFDSQTSYSIGSVAIALSNRTAFREGTNFGAFMFALGGTISIVKLVDSFNKIGLAGKALID